MIEFLNKLIATFVVAQNKFHSIHTDTTGAIFGDFHPLMGDVYSFFGDDNIDSLKERVRILGEVSPNNLGDLIDMSVIDEFTSAVPAISESINIVIDDLATIHTALKDGYKVCAECDDLETQQILIDLGLKLGVFEYKLKSIVNRK